MLSHYVSELSWSVLWRWKAIREIAMGNQTSFC